VVDKAIFILIGHPIYKRGIDRVIDTKNRISERFSFLRLGQRVKSCGIVGVGQEKPLGGRIGLTRNDRPPYDRDFGIIQMH
jgi:hypothetical protein